MATVEVAAITTITILGLASSAGVVWVGLGPLIANHLWSATDAYKSAKQKDDPIYQAQIVEAEHTLELSRQRRFGRNPEAGSIDIRRRVQMAGERAY